jgi:hypothetical protein
VRTSSRTLGARRALVAALLAGGLCAIVAREAHGSAAAPQNSLNAISCTVNGRCVAVGEIAAAGKVRPLIEALTGGRAWRANHVAPIDGASLLSGVSCVSGGFCVAVGSQPKQGALTEILGAGGWTHETVLSPPGAASLAAVSCASEGFCIAVGSTPLEQPLVESWDGVGWTQSSTHQIATIGGAGLLSGVSCATLERCVAVGTSFKGGRSSVLVAVYDDGVWRRVSTGAVGGSSTMTGVSCPDPDWCIAVGSHQTPGTAVTEPLALRVAGNRVTRLGLPPAPTASFNGVSCARVRRCVGVGDLPVPGQPAGGTDQAPFAEALNGGVWTSLAPVADGTSDTFSGGVSCVHARTCTAVGYGVLGASAAISATSQRLRGSAWMALATPSSPD